MISSIPVTKIVILGEARVGKTSLLIRYVENVFDSAQKSTVNASYLEKKLKITHKQELKLSIWDTAGQEIFHAMAPMFYRDADGALIVYDITDLGSFDKVKEWTQELKYHGNDINIAIVGNKCDLEASRAVNSKESLMYAKSVNARHFHVSAKTGEGVHETFKYLATEIIKRKDLYNEKASQKDGPIVTSTNTRQAKKRGIKITRESLRAVEGRDEDGNPIKNNKSGCCK